ncbi:MAG: TIGR04282 family arsenosugar biosynthesis glycosyltransferase [gamma proteobacterium symbiont of Lucinoma myriamae]|nr:TIGR04282 family arsenosugar biosynthesis glycosyltransferase [gamma proteobacterium symbiont of Lucinoma myriamae]MCU7833227.1 TIGR04282 family arsenosugar biosynthesis glycosyltransferase [gamma proteobacterium symbiont of Lucinoma myriamae]
MNKSPFRYPDTLVIIFAREPLAGQVKTRLIPTLGEEGATKIYKQLLDYAINNVITSNLSPANICITPESNRHYFTQMTCSSQFELSVQSGNDLGERMYNSLIQALKHYSKAILIGTDCPFLSHNDLQQSIATLDNNDMVFSPANDGGYVLVGANAVNPVVFEQVFEQIDWGTEKVMAQTRMKLLKHKVSWQELSAQNDIDIEADLKYLPLHNKFQDFIKN